LRRRILSLIETDVVVISSCQPFARRRLYLIKAPLSSTGNSNVLDVQALSEMNLINGGGKD
jgi:hypothetical protein